HRAGRAADAARPRHQGGGRRALRADLRGGVQQRLSRVFPHRPRLRPPELRRLWKLLWSAGRRAGARCRGRAVEPPGEPEAARVTPGLAGEGADERRLLAGRGIAVDHAPADRAVELTDGRVYLFRRLGRLAGDRVARRLHRRADGAPERAVAQAPLLILLDPLLGGTRIGHDDLPPVTVD